jgi:miniconductance mechanosensitive channel
MNEALTYLYDQLIARGMAEPTAAQVAFFAGLVVLLTLAWLANLIAKRVILRAVTGVVRRTSYTWDDAFVQTGVFTRLSHIAPALVFNFFGDDVFGATPEMQVWVDNFVSVYLIIIGLSVISAVLNSALVIANRTESGRRLPVKGFVQAVKLIVFLVGGIFILSAVFNKTPVYFLSGLGALTAVLILIFKDAILGFVAGIQISVNQMVRVGDWIEMPKAGADGDVIDVSLTTVKVRNWDKTITTIPTYSLISDSFKNWHGMKEAGGRRIKRSLFIDLQTVGFADEQMLQRWRKLRRLKPYLEEKLTEIAKENEALGLDLGVLGNGRRLTNLGTFRAYVAAYLREHPKIHQDMTFLVRQLQPTEHGLPLEIYVFTNDTRWPVYEGIQADIFDHLVAMVPEFGLRVFQQPSGHDLRMLGEALSQRLPRPDDERPLPPRQAEAGGVT